MKNTGKRSISQYLPKKIGGILLILFTTLKNPLHKINRLHFLEVLKDNNEKVKNDEYWYKKYKSMLLENNSPKCDELMKEFYSADIRLEKKAENDISEDDVVLFCALKNEELRIKEFIEYHRSIGIKRFVIVDNESADGTIPYLMNQKDVTIYKVETLYNSTKKSAWINRAIDMEGMHRYCLVLDADEFFVYEDCEKLDINLYVKRLNEKGIRLIKGFMLNMYPDRAVDEVDLSKQSFREAYSYFDPDSDDYIYDFSRNRLYGGIYKRIANRQYSLMAKTPLFLATDRFVFSSHETFPFYEERTANYMSILQHYKFLPGEKSKVKDIAKRGNYSNGSQAYKAYEKIYEENNMNMFYEGSAKWDGGSKDMLKRFPVIRLFGDL